MKDLKIVNRWHMAVWESGEGAAARGGSKCERSGKATLAVLVLAAYRR